MQTVDFVAAPSELKIAYNRRWAVFYSALFLQLCSNPLTLEDMSHSSSMKTYRQDEVQEILHLAIAHQAEAGELTREQLFEIADELGLSTQDIQNAEQEWQGLRRIDEEKQAFIKWRRLQFHQHSIKYLIVNGFLVVFDLLTFGDAASGLVIIGTHALSFSLFIALVWGLFLALDGWQSRQTEGKAFERKLRKWQRRQWLTRSISNLFSRIWGAA